MKNKLRTILLGLAFAVLTNEASAVIVAAGAQVGGVNSSDVPSLAFITKPVVVAANLGGSSLVRDGISFTGIAAAGNPTVANLGSYTVTASAPSSTLSADTFGDALFGSFIWADIQDEMSVKIEGLDPGKTYSVYFLDGDNRAISFDMLLTLSATDGVQTNSSAGSMVWGANSSSGKYYIYLPTTVSGATLLTATMTKNSLSAGAGFAGVVVVDETAAPVNNVVGDPRTNSWYTANSGKYARIYTTDANKTNGVSVTTWSNGSQTQATPAYVGVQEIYSSSNWVYIRTTGLGTHTMGPWYNDVARTTAFVNMPANQKAFYRFPRTPITNGVHTTTTGEVGYMVDGVKMFDSRDAVSYINSTGQDGNPPGGGGLQGDGIWNRDAYVNEATTFDPSLAHQQNTGVYHYHASPLALRYMLGDNVDFNAVSKAYTPNTNAPLKHSPIIAWANDGFPIYGPFGYSNPTNASSGVRRMVSGFVLRDGSNGTTNLSATGRTTLAAWAQRAQNRTTLSASQYGPAVSSSFPLGRYVEDNDYLGDLGQVQGVGFDLDEYNGRYCVTPEFPNGTYAYFNAISASGAPTYPYNVGRQFNGTPTAGNVTTLTETVVTNFLGGPASREVLGAPMRSGDTVILKWSAVEGGTYRVESSTNLTAWTTNASGIAPLANVGSNTNTSTESAKFFRVNRSALATYDSAGGTTGGGGGSTSVAPGGSAARGTTVTVTITLPTTPPWPPANAPISSVTLAGSITGTSVSDATQGQVVATFAIPSNAPTNAQNVVVTFNMGPTYTLTGGFTINP